MDKNFIVSEYDLEKIETVMEENLNEFIINVFGEKDAKKIICKAEYVEYMDDDMKCFKDELRCELWLTIEFSEYVYSNKVHGKQNESIGIMLEYKGSQPFYIDGKFVSRNVFEWIQGTPIQKTDKIYGISKDVIYDAFNGYIMTC